MLTKRDLLEMIDSLDVEITAMRREQMDDHEKLMTVIDLLKDLVGEVYHKKKTRKKKDASK